MMARELNISLIIGIVVAILPVWQWDSGIELLISAFYDHGNCIWNNPVAGG